MWTPGITTFGSWKRRNSADQLFVLPVFVSSLFMSFLWNAGVALAEGRPRHRGHAVHKLGLEEHIGVGEHAVLQGHHHELQGEVQHGHVCILKHRPPSHDHVPESAENVRAASVRCSGCGTDPGRRRPRPGCRWEQV